MKKKFCFAKKNGDVLLTSMFFEKHKDIIYSSYFCVDSVSGKYFPDGILSFEDADGNIVNWQKGLTFFQAIKNSSLSDNNFVESTVIFKLPSEGHFNFIIEFCEPINYMNG